MSGRLEERGRRSRRRNGVGGQKWARWVAGIVLALVILAVGIALGRALEDNPRPGITVTTTKTVVP